MRPKSTIALLVIAVLAVAYFLLVEQPRHRRNTERAAHNEALTLLDLDTITGVTIHRPGDTLEFARRDGVWYLVEPTTDKADPRSLNTLLKQITTTTIDKRFLVEKTDLAKYGLDNPAATVRLSGDPDDAPLVLHVGDLSLTKNLCYTRIEGKPDVLLLDAGVRRSSLLSLFKYRDKKVVDLTVAGVRRLETIANGRSTNWSRDDNNTWFAVLAEDSIRGDETRIDNIIRELRGLRAKDIPFPVTDPEVYFTEVAGQINLWGSAEGDVVSIRFAKESEDSATCFVHASHTGRVSLVESVVLEVFDNTYNDLRDRRLLSFDPETVARITMYGPGGEVTIIRSGSAWTFANPEFGSIAPKTANALIRQISGLEYATALEEPLTDTGGFGLEDPAYRLLLVDPNGATVDELKTGGPLADNASSYVTSLSTGVLASIQDAKMSALFAAFRNLGE